MPQILIAEDDRGVQTLLKTLLTREGYVVECADDGIEALRRCRSRAYDLILLDLAMPKSSGLDVLRQLEEDGRADVLSRIVVVTAASVKEIGNVRGVPVLRKPFDLAEFFAAVRRITGIGRRTDAPIIPPREEQASTPR